jgi:branched-chain amino acid transport system ATP-binding protein
MSLLKVEKLEVTYHRVITAVQGVTLEVPRGALVALLGNNGAGKTTTLRAISGFIGLDDARVTEGTITYGGERIENQPPHRIARRGVVLVPERSKVFENLTVEENLRAAVPRPGGRFAGEKVYEFFPALGAAATPATSPAESGRCSRSARRCAARRSCFSSTSSRRVSRRCWCGS